MRHVAWALQKPMRMRRAVAPARSVTKLAGTTGVGFVLCVVQNSVCTRFFMDLSCIAFRLIETSTQHKTFCCNTNAESSSGQTASTGVGSPVSQRLDSMTT